MKVKEEILLNRFVYLINSYIDSNKIYLFGSRAKGNYRNSADFDLAIDSEINDYRSIRIIKDKINEIAGLYHVDIVNINSVDKEFKDIILETGKLIYEK
jgi:predicted nucleotidyltransferase